MMYTKVHASTEQLFMSLMKRTFARRILKLLRAVYYQIVFGRSVPFAGKLTKIVSSWEKKLGVGDIAASSEIWDSQYLAGRWNCFGQLEELARHSVIVGYLQYLKPGGSVLDVGCGEGILFRKYSPYGYSKYTGIDISEVAIDKLSQEQGEKTLFIRANAENYMPTDLFDAVVFNDSLYYFDEPLEVVGRYIHALKEDGILIISTYVKSKRAISILKRIKATYFLLDEVKTTHKLKSWICSVFVPSKSFHSHI